jgi:methylenetetrahydrofolate reductase (NADPH)
MKLTELWDAKSKPTVSFELFPARNPEAAEKLPAVIDKLSDLKPDFFGVTFGAGGSTREGSSRLIDTLKNGKQSEVVAYFACYGLGPSEITAALDDYRGMGVENVLAVRGDAPQDGPDFRPHPESLSHASDLLALIKQGYDFCLGAAGYPEGHIEAESKEKDLEFLKLKVKCGAEFIITNYFYDNIYYFDFVKRCRAAGITVPILPGIMPIFSEKMMRSLAALCGATIPSEIERGLAALPEGDRDALVGLKQFRGLIDAGVPGLHIYTMDRARSATAIVRKLRGEGLV